MVLLEKLKELADRVLGEDQRAKHLREEELQLAAAALLVHASLIDGRADPEERRKLKSLLQVRFNLADDEFDRILERLRPGSRSRLIYIASRACSAASLIRREDSASSKCFGKSCSQMVCCMNTKPISFRGGAELLGVSTRDRVRLRKIVESRTR
jgi:uncharacterized tellurite resistance protein B-like protein